jgi:cytochrome c
MESAIQALAALVGAVVALGLAGTAWAAPSPDAGRLVAQRECGSCHAVGSGGASPFADAPPFPSLRRRYNAEQFAALLPRRLEEAHPRMPRLRLDPDEEANLTAYWGGIRPQRPSASLRRGEAIARASCAPCHAIGEMDESPRPGAPPLRGLARDYPVGDLIAAIGEGASTGHPEMPRFRLRLRNRQDLVAYVRSIQR